jgi:hypothetical protein
MNLVHRVSFGINDVEQMVGAHIFLAKPTDGVAQQYQINGRSAGLIIPVRGVGG